jgi:ribosomal protein L10
MSKRIKTLVENDLGVRLKGLEGLAVLNPVGLDGNRNNKLRRALHDKGMRMTVVKNSLARRAGSSTKVKGFEKLLNGPSAIVYGDASVQVSAIARLLVDLKKEDEKLELRGAFFDGEAYDGQAGVEQVSKFPTREEAIGQVLGAILGPARQLAGILNQGGMLAGLVAAIEHKQAGAEPAAA